MKKLFKIFISLFLIASFSIATAHCGSCGTGCYNSCNSCCDCCDDCNNCLNQCDGYPYMAYRSQGVNAARELVGWQEFINLTDACDYNGAFYAAFEYTRTFKPEKIAQFYFGNQLVGCNSLLIQGSDVENRNNKAWLAEYFGLPEDFDSCVTLCPRIENFIVDLSYYQGLDKWKEGLYFRIWAPIVHTRWNLCMNECVKDKGEAGFIAGYMSEDVIEREDLPESFTEVMNSNITFGDMKDPICYGRMSKCRLSETKLADIHLAFGYNFVRKEDGHLGAHIYLGAPTGNRPCAKCLFEPIVGNGKHWELGLGLTSSWIFWRDECEKDRYMGVFWDANFTHLFKTCQWRSFDYCNKPNSRYYLLAQMGDNATDDTELKAGDGPDATKYQYQGSLVPAINKTTFKVDVSIPFQFDWAIKLAYYRDNWSFDLGYNLWARTGEKFCKCTDCCNDCCDNCCGCNSCDSNCGCGCNSTCTKGEKYAAKGDALLYGFADGYITQPVALSSSQSGACISTGMNLKLINAAEAQNAFNNKGIDNPALAFNADDDELTHASTTLLGELLNQQLYTSQEAVLATNLNMCKSPSAITHKIFAHINYTWKDGCGCDDKWTPFLGIGVEAEFAPCGDCCNDCCNDSCCNPCNTTCGTSCYNSCESCYNSCNDGCNKKRAGVNQWGVWIKGGVAYE